MVKKQVLRIKIVGHESITAWKNETREGNQPHYKGNGIAVWVAEVEVKEKDAAIADATKEVKEGELAWA